MKNDKAALKLKYKMMRHFLESCIHSSYFNAVIIIVIYLSYTFLLEVNSLLLPYWLAYMMTLIIIRSVFSIAGLRDDNAPKLTKTYYISCFLTVMIAAGWSCFYIELFRVGASEFAKMYFLMIIVGLCAGSTFFQVSSKLGFFAFNATIILTVIYQNFTFEFSESLLISFLGLFQCILLTSLFKRFRGGFRKEMQLSIEKDKLISQLTRANQELDFVSKIDGLTNLANRRHFERKLGQDWASAKRTSAYISLIILDVDYFKPYNDHYGHVKGDECLRKVAEVIAKNIRRDTDLAARYGGDEFCIILFNTEAEAAKSIAKKITQDLHEANIEHKQSTISDRVTLSIGVSAMIPSISDDIETLIKMTDTKLYKAKHAGRNQVQGDKS